YSEPAGLDGHVELQDASVTLPDVPPLHAAAASVAIGGRKFSLEAATVKIGDDEAADVEGSFETGAGLDVRITTRSLNVADLRSFGLTSIPVVEQTPQGSWRGWARYHWRSGEKGEWTGEYELQNARIAIDGFAAPLRIQSAAVNCNSGRVAVSRMRARLGEIALTGEYRWDPTATRPHRFKVSIPNADAVELQALLAPALVRERGFLARTLRLGPAPIPEWLASRSADGTLSIDVLNVGDTAVRLDSARVLWDGAQIRLVHLNAHADQAAASGDLEINLANRVPHYRFDGKFSDLAYKGGRVDLDGSFESDGTGADLIAEARAQGSLRGRSIAFSPDAEFRTVAACFEMSPPLKLKISCLEVTQAGETFTGSGATQGDGRLVLDLTGRGRLLHYTSALLAGSSLP
ncbi:MAG: hypothetical protein LAO79_26395, partial [Acidobacteriia bacterium]|nr:hypothetical protein [Terriglobia bacterium]